MSSVSPLAFNHFLICSNLAFTAFLTFSFASNRKVRRLVAKNFRLLLSIRGEPKKEMSSRRNYILLDSPISPIGEAAKPLRNASDIGNNGSKTESNKALF